MAHRGPWVTIEQAIDVLDSLEPSRTLTAGQLRYWDRIGVIPVARADAAVSLPIRLYAALDVALVRVALRLLDAGLSMQQVSAAFKYRGAEIRAGLESSRAMAVVFSRGRLDVVPASDAAQDAIAVVSLRDCWRGVSSLVRAHARAESEVWIGWRKVPTAALVAAR